MSLSAIDAALEQFCVWTWKTSLHTSVLIALVLLIQFAFGKRLPVRLRYAFSLLVLLRLILPVAPATSFSVFNLGRHFASPLPASEIRPTTSMAAPALAQTIDIPVKLTTAPVKVSRFSLREVASTAWLSGLIVSLFVVLRQHRKLSRWITARPPLDNPRLAALLEECKTIMGVRREVRLILAPQRMTPALFGLRKPCLLLPDGLIQKLDERELRMVFLHELAHVKRADVLLNWIIIIGRSLHWINPLVWLAMRRLRADRELVCDAMVMSHLAVNERRAYGDTLIKLLDDFSGAGSCPSLAPVINHKHEIKRRVTMIAQFKPTNRIAFLFSAAIVLALCCFTFTRAAEKKGVSSGNATSNRTAESKPANEKSQSLAQVQIEYFEKLLQEQNAEVQKAQEYTDQLRKELRISGPVAEGTGSIALDPETVRRIEAARIEVESQYRGLISLVTLLKAKSEAELQKIINFAVPDEVLTSLLKSKSENEQRLANLSSKFGEANPEIKALREENRKVSDQVAERVQGILAGLQVRAEAMKAQIESLHRAVAEAKTKDAEMVAKFRPYFEAKRRLENLEKIRDAVSLRLQQERIDATLPKFKK